MGLIPADSPGSPLEQGLAIMGRDFAERGTAWMCTLKRVHIWGAVMKMVNVREAREQLSRLLDAVAAGEEVMIMRHGRPVARLVPAGAEEVAFRSRAGLRGSLPPMRRSAAEEARAGRDEERF